MERDSGRSKKASLGGTEDEGDSVFTVVCIRYCVVDLGRSCSGSGLSMDMMFDLLGGSFDGPDGGAELGAAGGLGNCCIIGGTVVFLTGDNRRLSSCRSRCPCI